MDNFAKVFSKFPALLAVIHVEHETQAIENARIAHGEGADGIFLINHRISSGKLREIYFDVRKALPKYWIGLNFLDATLIRMIGGILPDDSDGFWTDNAGYEPTSKDPVYTPRSIDELRRKRGGTAARQIYFGGVSFKHQHDTENVEEACKAANDCAPFVDVITTSGTKTGEPPSLEKIKAMHTILCGHPLAVASGLSPENIQPFLPYLSAILCATGISRSFTDLDPIKVRRMARLVHGS